MIDNYGTMSIKAIAKAIGRDCRSVENKVFRLGLGSVIDNVDGYSPKDISEMFGISYHTIMYWITTNKLKGRRYGSIHYVPENVLIKFMKENPDKWDATKCDCKWLFAGADWFEQKRKADFQKMVSGRWGKWYPEAK